MKAAMLNGRSLNAILAIRMAERYAGKTPTKQAFKNHIPLAARRIK